jgi:hypothetical protein
MFQEKKHKKNLRSESRSSQKSSESLNTFLELKGPNFYKIHKRDIPVLLPNVPKHGLDKKKTSTRSCSDSAFNNTVIWWQLLAIIFTSVEKKLCNSFDLFVLKKKTKKAI